MADPQDAKPKDVGVPADEFEAMTTLHERAIAALSYFGFLAIIPFYLKKDSKFCRFHGKQGVLLAIIFFMAQLLSILDIFHDLFALIQFILLLKMGFATLSGKWDKVPFIYTMACQLEEQLSIKTEAEVEEDEAFKPGQTESEKPKVK